MGSARTYLAAFAALPTIDNADERRRVARAGLAMLAQIADREPAPLEGLAADQLALAVRTALGDGLLADLDWMSPAASAIALFELAQALPPGAERRELGRRVLARLRDADRDTFVRLLIAFARSSPKVLLGETTARDHALRARTEVVLAAPLTAPGAVGELALALLAPFAADVYAAACLAFEILTGQMLIRGDTLNDVIDAHFDAQPGAAVLAQLARVRRLAPLGELIRAAVSRDPKRRPTVARLRAGFAAIAPDLRSLPWPIAIA